MHVVYNTITTTDSYWNPIICLNICIISNTVKYGLTVEDHLSMSIVAIGRVGVWRVTHMETIDSDQCVLQQISKEVEPFQPEQHGFIVVEIYKGMN